MEMHATSQLTDADRWYTLIKYVNRVRARRLFADAYSPLRKAFATEIKRCATLMLLQRVFLHRFTAAAMPFFSSFVFVFFFFDFTKSTWAAKKSG